METDGLLSQGPGGWKTTAAAAAKPRQDCSTDAEWIHATKLQRANRMIPAVQWNDLPLEQLQFWNNNVKLHMIIMWLSSTIMNYNMNQYDMIWYDMIWYDMIWYNMNITQDPFGSKHVL